MTATSRGDFSGNERFAIVRRLGAGGFGIVYEAFDRERRQTVALKTLRRFDAAALYRFKQEFRSLADLAHPNLITLYELLSDGDQWFFTMELVNGVPFVEYVRRMDRHLPGHVSEADVSTRSVAAAETSTRSRPPDVVDRGALDESRLRPALAQLAEAVCAIHAAGILHRDIKPSNVLVTPEGRAILLDFGLVTALRQEGSKDDALIAGTPGYMSPEQAAGKAVTAASDWYGFGALLHEAIAGTRPDADWIGDISPEAPADLRALCTALLDRDPLARPFGMEVVRRLQQSGAASAIARAERAAPPFVGRERELAALRAAHDTVAGPAGGATAVVLLRGRSGMGKTALAHHFLETIRQQ